MPYFQDCIWKRYGSRLPGNPSTDDQFVIQAYDLNGWSSDVFFSVLLYVINSAQVRLLEKVNNVIKVLQGL